MHYLVFALLASLLSSCVTPHSKDLEQFDTQFSVQEVAAQTFVVTDRFYHESNVLVALMPDQTVFIASSPFEAKGAELLVNWIQQTLKPKRMVAINTHFHSDGTAGNPAYLNAGVEVWAGDKTLALQKAKAESYRDIEARDFETKPELKQRILERKIAYADHIFPTEAGKEFLFGPEKVEVIYPGPAHTLDNVVVYLPERKVLFGGCMIRPKDSLGPTADADLKAWSGSVSSLQKLDARVVIAGHSKVGGPELIQRTVELSAKSKLAR